MINNDEFMICLLLSKKVLSSLFPEQDYTEVIIVPTK